MHALAIFAAGTAASMLASCLLVSRLERISGAAGPVRGAAGIVAALAADAPGITAATAALASHRQR